MSIRTRSANPAFSQRMGLAGSMLALAVVGVSVVAGAWYVLRDESTSSPVATTAPVAQSAQPATFTTPNVRTPGTIFVVATESQKTLLEADIEEAARIRYSTGVEPAKESVVIMPSDEALRVYAESIESNNAILAGLGFDGDVIVDLRPR